MNVQPDAPCKVREATVSKKGHRKGRRKDSRRVKQEAETGQGGGLFIDDHTVAPGRPLSIVILTVAGAAASPVATPAPRAPAVELDPLAVPRDAVPLAGAAATRAAQGARGAGRAAAAAGEGGHVAVAVGAVLV